MPQAAEDALARYRAFLVDVDGVLTRGNDAIAGAVEGLAALRRRGRTLVLTNNSTRSRSDLAAHLKALGFEIPRDDVLGSAFLAARSLILREGPTAVWVLGEDGVRREMLEAGHRLAEEPAEAAWVVVGMDRALTYEKLAHALRALAAGARVLATNEDATFPTPDGFVPGAGALVGALRGMGYPPAWTAGKPSLAAFEVALDALGLGARDVLMVGDRLDTDIAGARAAGLDSVLVGTGVHCEADAARSDVRPTWIAESLLDVGRASVRALDGCATAR